MLIEPNQILAHRGLWTEANEQNSFVALARALDEGFGIETDVRDHNQDLVVSHDLPTGQSWPLVSLLEYYESSRSTAWLALNIKADGLADSLQELMAHFSIGKYFVFDMSVPDMRHYDRLSIPFLTRQSELEAEPALYDRACGVWLDAFDGQWYSSATIQGHLEAGKHVAVVSPELHRRPVESTWDLLWNLVPSDRTDSSTDRKTIPGRSELLVCTDHPREFRQRQGT